MKKPLENEVWSLAGEKLQVCYKYDCSTSYSGEVLVVQDDSGSKSNFDLEEFALEAEFLYVGDFWRSWKKYKSDGSKHNCTEKHTKVGCDFLAVFSIAVVLLWWLL